MNLQQYQQLKTYLETTKTLNNLNQTQQQRFRKQATHYVVQNDLLFRKNKKTNGLTERFNKTLCSTLAKLVGDYKTTRDTLLPAALFAYHTFPNHTSKYDPFYLIYGHTATLPLDLQLQPEEDISKPPLEQSLKLHVNKITEQLYQQRIQAQSNIQRAQQKQKKYHDCDLKTVKFKISNSSVTIQVSQRKDPEEPSEHESIKTISQETSLGTDDVFIG
ncbi:6094_t:CDS:2 [Dentiscutata erythropus]|uniref:6094_t:CDS:1 n=1 Tax=Dentiscutata erythropus TaxID=1348616 RepID=A0A9N9EPH3_9GLOM|nr:6094_t:CDS:2 [Dentiscutata erythropus]